MVPWHWERKAVPCALQLLNLLNSILLPEFIMVTLSHKELFLNANDSKQQRSAALEGRPRVLESWSSPPCAAAAGASGFQRLRARSHAAWATAFRDFQRHRYEWNVNGKKLAFPCTSVIMLIGIYYFSKSLDFYSFIINLFSISANTILMFYFIFICLKDPILFYPGCLKMHKWFFPIGTIHIFIGDPINSNLSWWFLDFILRILFFSFQRLQKLEI